MARRRTPPSIQAYKEARRTTDRAQVVRVRRDILEAEGSADVLEALQGRSLPPASIQTSTASNVVTTELAEPQPEARRSVRPRGWGVRTREFHRGRSP
jgi:hypothetical protein